MRQLARSGFGDAVPMLQSEKPEQRRSAFQKFADNYQTKWAICPSCENVAKHFKANKPVSQVKAEATAIGSLVARAVSFSPNPRRLFIAFKNSEFAPLVVLFVIFVAGSMAWQNAQRQYDPVRWWWQSRGAIAEAKKRVASRDWHATRTILRNAIAEYPDNPLLLRRAANVEIILGRPEVAAFHLQAIASIAGLPFEQRQEAYASAMAIASRLRARAREIVSDVYRIYAATPFFMKDSSGRTFDPLEAIAIPPASSSDYLRLSSEPKTYDRMQVICFDIEKGGCAWSFARTQWREILIDRHIRIQFPNRNELRPCCELSLDDPDLENPVRQMVIIGGLQKELQLRAMFRLATKLAFVANMIAFNERRTVPFRQ